MRVRVLDGPGRELQQVLVAENGAWVQQEAAQTAVSESEPRPPAAFPAAAAVADGSAGVSNVVRSCLAETLKIPPGRIAGDVPFSDYGIDSILGVSFVNRLNERLGIALGRAIIYDYASVDRLSGHILASGLATPEPPPASAAVPAGLEEIAVIGVALQVPDAADPETFWANLMAGHESLRELPAEYGGAGMRGGALAGRDEFDTVFFGLSEADGLAMSRHQRLVLQEGWKALEDAGIDPRGLSGARVGVYVGAEPSGWFQGSFSGASDAIIASRLSYHLDLKGPALVVNTGCSSSGTAIHLACESLRLGETRLALAGGVAASLGEEALHQLRGTDMLSSTGRCRTFAADADGMVLSEAVGMVVLKRLQDAIADGDPIHGVIQAWGMNQDGTSNGITAPNGKAQEELLVETWQRFGVSPEALTHFEVHGTGTRLGDAVEGNALVRAFRRHTDRQGYCVLGMSKTSIGHTGAASGVVGLIKLLLALRHRQLPAPPVIPTINPLIELEGSALALPTAPIPWHPAEEHPRTAGLNAFGHSGTNVHLVVREADALPVAQEASRLLPVPLSAVDQAQLREMARRLLGALEGQEDPPTLAQIAFTCQIGRTALAERLVILACDGDELRNSLRRYLEGAPPAGGLWRGRVESDAASWSVRVAVEPEALAEAWVRGEPVDWAALYGGSLPRRCHLPCYPFLRCSTERPSDEAAGAEPPADGVERGAVRLIGALLARPLKCLVGEIRRQVTWRDLGLSSLMLVGFARDLSSVLGTQIRPSLLFEYPTVARLAEHLGGRFGDALETLDWDVITEEPTISPPAAAPEDGAAPAQAQDTVLSALEGLRDGSLGYQETLRTLKGGRE